jgi:hypothetical protein
MPTVAGPAAAVARAPSLRCMRSPLRRLAALVIFTGFATVVIMPASVAGARPVEVRPFSEVQASDIAFSRDPSDPTRGIFRVETSEPMICAIVWGPTKSFGRFNNSLSMNGTGITEHDVLLPDVDAGVTYRYIVQGTTADGTLYRSKVGAFRLAAGDAVDAPAKIAGLTNVATAATVVASSSEYSSSFSAAYAIDGDTKTEWATKGDGDAGSITIDLGRAVEVAAVEFVTRSMADGTAVTSRFTVALDGGAPLGPFPAGTVARPRPATIGATGQVMRFDVARSSGGNVGAVEIRVYEAA